MVVTLQNISKRLGSFSLTDISLSLPGGYITGLIGQNGAGKTTLLRILLGLYRPDAGEVRIDGRSYQDQEIWIRERTGAVLLEELFERGLTLRENGAVYGRFFPKYRQERFEDFLVRFALSPKRRCSDLSRGERLKLQLAFALSHDARLLVLDEPTGNFDPEFRRVFFEVLKEFIADGERSVVLATHLTDDLDRIADYIVYLENGTGLFAGDVETMRAQYRIAEGDGYRLRALPGESVIHMQERAHGARALVRGMVSDPELTFRAPTLEELMYFMSKRNGE